MRPERLVLERGESDGVDVLVVDEHDGVGLGRLRQRDEVDEPLEPEREPDCRDVLAEEAPDHAVVATAAAEAVPEVRVRHLEDRARVVAHAADQGGVEAQVGPGQRVAEAQEVGERLGVEPLGVGDGGPVGGLERPDRVLEPGQLGAGGLAQFGGDPVRPDLVELVDRDEGTLRGGGVDDAPRPEQRRQDPPVVDPDGRARDAEGVEGRGRRADQLDLGELPGLAEHVDVALHELAVAPLLRTLGAPHGCDLHRPEHRRELGTVRGVEAGERDGEVEPEPEVCEVERSLGTAHVVRREPALHHGERELLVVAAEAGVQAGGLLDDRRLDLVEPVLRVHAADDSEDVLPSCLVRGEVVSHATGGRHGGRHAPILPERTGPLARVPAR
ncbi:hypothetical protein Cus16_1204 [Curtobacterium sp. ER1/6]|nr:hypothetical protein Cus16_1204 [Curtobacterium sp. ER1/6]